MYPVIVDLIPHARDLLGAGEEAEHSAVDGQRSHDRRAQIAQRSVEGGGHVGVEVAAVGKPWPGTLAAAVGGGYSNYLAVSNTAIHIKCAYPNP